MLRLERLQVRAWLHKVHAFEGLVGHAGSLGSRQGASPQEKVFSTKNGHLPVIRAQWRLVMHCHHMRRVAWCILAPGRPKSATAVQTACNVSSLLVSLPQYSCVLQGPLVAGRLSPARLVWCRPAA